MSVEDPPLRRPLVPVTISNHDLGEGYDSIFIHTILETINSGAYFCFDKGTGAAGTYTVKQCRAGAEIWSGEIVWWDYAKSNSGSGDSHGRTNRRRAAGQWATNDTITGPKLLSNAGSTHASCAQMGCALERRSLWQPLQDATRHVTPVTQLQGLQLSSGAQKHRLLQAMAAPMGGGSV